MSTTQHEEDKRPRLLKSDRFGSGSDPTRKTANTARKHVATLSIARISSQGFPFFAWAPWPDGWLLGYPRNF